MNTRPTTNAALFVAAGRALFGDAWQQPTAKLLGWAIDNKGQNRAVQRIAAAAAAGDDYRINTAAMLDLAQHLSDRATEAKDVAKAIQKANRAA